MLLSCLHDNKSLSIDIGVFSQFTYSASGLSYGIELCHGRDLPLLGKAVALVDDCNSF